MLKKRLKESMKIKIEQQMQKLKSRNLIDFEDAEKFDDVVAEIKVIEEKLKALTNAGMRQSARL